LGAAYVAERVLTAAELKDYVDEFWPPASAAQVAAENETFPGSEVNPAHLREKIRYLLARRLTRELRGDLAREYYPAQWVSAFDQLAAELRAGWDEAQPAETRAGALFRAAMMTRTNGLELIGTEGAPDWACYQGQFEMNSISGARAESTETNLARPTQEELRRNAAHAPDPDARFHYRYQAASLAWEAAKLLPNNDDRTAYILWQGGTFLKYQDPDYADIFYKALVRRNRKTALGKAADEQRWFPVINENGEIVPRKPRRILLEPAPDESSTEEMGDSEPEMPAEDIEVVPSAATAMPAEKGYEYVVRRGDSLASIAQGFVEAGVAATRESILEANPGLDATRLRIGQRILIPVLTK
jgi:hypothetical protein